MHAPPVAVRTFISGGYMNAEAKGQTEALIRVARPLWTVAELHEFVGREVISERSLRRALEPGGDLADLAVRIGKRVLVKAEVALGRFGHGQNV